MTRSRELALTGALLCATAAVLGIPALWAPGIAALLATALARLWVARSAAGAELTLSCAARTVEEDEPVEMIVRVRRGRIPFPGGTLVPWPGAGELALPAGRELEISGQALIPRRGRHLIGPARLRVSDPFGLCSRELSSEGSELLVLPRVQRLDASALAFLEGAGGSPREPPQALDSLRAHRPGSPASRIHWPTVARSGILMERSMRPEDDPRVLLELDAAGPESEEALDRAVRAAASLCFHLARRGGCLVLLPDDPRPTVLGTDLQGWPAVHARLALITARAGARRASGAHRGLSLIRVTASAAAPGAEIGPHFRVGPHPVAGPATLFTVAGCSAQYLDGALGVRAA